MSGNVDDINYIMIMMNLIRCDIVYRNAIEKLVILENDEYIWLPN